MLDMKTFIVTRSIFGSADSGGGSGSGGSLPSGVYFKGACALPESNINNRLFSLNGDTYLWTRIGSTNGKAKIYKYENDEFVVYQDVPSDFASVWAGTAKPDEIIEFHGKAFFRYCSRIGIWDGVNFTNLGDVVAYHYESEAFIIMDDTLFSVASNTSKGLEVFMYDESSNTFIEVGTVSIPRSSFVAYHVNGKPYLLFYKSSTVSDLYEYTTEGMTLLASIPVRFPYYYAAIGNSVYMISNQANIKTMEIIKYDFDTGELTNVGKPPYLTYQFDCLNDVIHWTDSTEYQAHCIMHEVSE